MANVLKHLHSFVAQSDDRRLIIISAYTANDGSIQLESEDGIAVTKTGDGVYSTPDGHSLRSSDPQRA